jgi:trimethylamine---corrinoid protein Co-methyltransferase
MRDALVVEALTQTLHQATLALLDRTGVAIDSDAALERLAAHGVRVNFDSRRVYPREEHIEPALAGMPRRITIYGREAESAVHLAGDNVYVMSGGASLRVHTLDGQYAAATWEHLRQFNTLLDALPNIHMCVNQVDPTDEPTDHFYRRIAAEMFISCRKPIDFQVGSAADVRAMIDMGTAIRGSREALLAQPMFMIGLNAEPPLRISRDVAEALMAASEAGLPTSLGHYAMAGITAPATTAGTVVHINATQLTAFVLAQLVHPGAPLIYTAFSGGGNMRTLDVMASSPHAVRIMRLATALGRSYGLPVYATAATDGRQPDAQAACERAVQVYALAETGAHIIQGPTSSMDQYMLSSFAQAVIDNDIVGYALAARVPPEITADALALEATHEVLTDPWLKDLKFAGHPHTVEHSRAEMWEPRCFDYANFAAWQRGGGQTVVERATAVARDILDRHMVESLPAVVAAELRRVATA